MSCFFHKLISVTHGATFDRPKSASIQGNWDWATSDAGGQVTDECLTVKRSTYTANVEWEVLSEGDAALNSASFVATLEDDEGGTQTVTLPTCLAGPVGFKGGGGSNANMSQEFRYQGTSIEPVSVGA